MASHPKISIVMSAYNAAAYLDEAVNSILSQTFRDFEFIVIDNGSSDETGAILERYRKLDGRMRVYRREQEGWARAFNDGCRRARGEYIALMDADDVSLGQRLEKQVAYLERHPRIGIVGTWISKVDKHGSTRGSWYPPTNPNTLKWTHFFGVCVASPTVLVRREILERLGFVRTDLHRAEDVDLWLRASLITEFGNVPEVLYRYRVWPGSNTHLHLKAVRETHVRLLASFIKDFLSAEPPPAAVAGLRQTRVGPLFNNLKDIRLTADLIQTLHRHFVEKNDLTCAERREISRDAAKRLASLSLQAARFHSLAFPPLFLRSLRLDHRLLYPSALTRGLERRRWLAAMGDEELCRVDV